MDLLRLWSIFLVCIPLVVGNHLQTSPNKLPAYENAFRKFARTQKKSQNSAQSQCTFKNSLGEDVMYAIGQRWSPDFGSLGGVQVCIICTCSLVEKKNGKLRKARSRVKCRNFQKECPVPKCKNPRIKEGFCCKSCPEDEHIELAIRANETIKEQTGVKRKRNYVAILTVNGTKNETRLPLDTTNHALFQMRKNILNFEVHTLGKEKPTFVRFHDINDTILEEFEIIGNTSLPHNYRINGSWTDMATNFRRMLLAGECKFSVSFEEDPEAESKLFGTIQPYLFEKKFNHRFQGDLSAVKYAPKANLKLLNDESENQENALDYKIRCTYNKRLYEEGEQWPNFSDQCQMCTCQRDGVRCLTEICMSLGCKEQIQLPGQCCPVCKDSYIRYNGSCEFQNRRYLPGSKWHPFIPPNGFDRCTSCMCQPDLDIKCERKKCPTLDCSIDDTEIDETGCCRKCINAGVEVGDSRNRPQYDMAFDDPVEIQKMQDEEMLRGGGCRHRNQIHKNGAEWNPSMGSYGSNKCIVCKCKDGVRQCSGIVCRPQPNCKQLINVNYQCCPICADNQSRNRSNRKSAKRSESHLPSLQSELRT